MPTIEHLLRTAAREQHIAHWIVEKDYALGYLLAGMAQVPALADTLILKGGTALRKFYFPDYRFSEDLDFTALQHPGDMDAAMQSAVAATQTLLLEQGPFEVGVERLQLRDPHPGGQDAFTVRVRFPTHREALCRLKVEITYDEELLAPPATRALLHLYPPPLHVHWRCYALVEVVAEKLRALLQSRARLHMRGWGASRVCRDYYDLWYLLRHNCLELDALPDLLARKCALRQVTFSGLDDFLASDLQAVAQAEWERQLLPFAPDAPSATQVLTDLTGYLSALPLEV